MVATCVSGDLHEIGVRMVADFFQMDGWDTIYLGANTPPRDVVTTVAEAKADFVAISATMAFHLDAVSELIRQLRATSATAKIPILVGGHPFNLAPTLVARVGADGTAKGAAEAREVISDLLDP